MGIFKKIFGKNMDEFCAPMTGKAVAISEVPDPTFAEGMLGNGIAIEHNLPVAKILPCKILELIKHMAAVDAQ